MKYLIIYAIAKVLSVPCPDKNGNKSCKTVIYDTVTKEIRGRQAAINFYNQMLNRIDSVPNKGAAANTQNVTFVRFDSAQDGPRKFVLPAVKTRLN